MKRKVFCALILVIWLLVACTFLSVKIEQEMTPHVTTTQPDMSGNIAIDSLFWDEYGGMRLFAVREGGTGWESGTRARELSNQEYSMEYTETDPPVPKLSVSGWGMSFIQYATKFPVVGALIEVEKPRDKADDHWLMVNPNGFILPEEYGPGVTEETGTDTALLLTAEEQPTPFMPDRAYTAVYKGDPALRNEFPDPGTTLYSLNDVTTFMDQMLLVALVAGIILFAVILWFCTCFMLKNARRNRVLLIINSVLAVGTLIGLLLTLRVIHLPSSLLPLEVILEIDHYKTVFGGILGNLEALRVNGSAVAASVIDHTAARTTQVLLVVGGSVALAVLVGAVELILAAHNRTAPEPISRPRKPRKPAKPRPQRSAGKAGARQAQRLAKKEKYTPKHGA